MRLLSDTIEEFIKSLLVDEEEVETTQHQTEVELRRNELAEHFQCAPSQINYVLATRFTPEHGYLIESRRGGGGYIRIVRIGTTSREELLQSIYQRIGTSINSVTEDEASLMVAALNPTAVPLPLQMKDALSAGILRSMLMSIAKRKVTKRE